MGRQKIDPEKIKPKISVYVNNKLLEIMEEHLNKIDVNRSKYVENLIRKDMQKRGFDIEPDFEK